MAIELFDSLDRNNWESAWAVREDSIDMLDHWETCVELMDEDLRDQCHREVCMGGLPENDNAAFLARYMELHFDKYHENFSI